MATDLGSTGPVFFPNGVADPEGRTGFLADASDGVVAVDLVTGTVRWRSGSAERPLIVVGQRLAALRSDRRRQNAAHVAVLDVAHGQQVMESDPLVFPDWVALGATALALDARAERDSLELEWQAQVGYGGGAAPPAHVLQQASQTAGGIARVSLATGEATMLANGQADQLRATRPTGLGTTPRKPGFDPAADEWQAGARRALLVWEPECGELALQPVTWDTTGGDARTTALARGRGLVARVTPDGRYVFVHREEPEPRPGPWQVFAAETGEPVATLTYEPGAHSPCVLAGRVYYFVDGWWGASSSRGAAPSMALKARDVATDTLLWELPLATGDSAPPPLRQ